MVREWMKEERGRGQQAIFEPEQAQEDVKQDEKHACKQGAWVSGGAGWV